MRRLSVVGGCVIVALAILVVSGVSQNESRGQDTIQAKQDGQQKKKKGSKKQKRHVLVIRGTETRNRNAKLRGFLQEVGPVVFELLSGRGEPDLNGFGHLEQVIYMPMRRAA